MNFEAVGLTDVGLKRDNNQDSILLDKDLMLFIVADGMGGHKGGEVASSLAVQCMQQMFKTEIQSGRKINPKELLKAGYREATQKIYSKATYEQPDLMGMGTTMVAAFIYNGVIYFANVGDSRAYMYCNDILWQLTDDHSLVNEQIRAGVLDPNHPDAQMGRNVITRSVGFEDVVDVDIIERDLQPGETFLLCSDGLSGLVSNQKIAEIIKKNTPQTIALKCVEEAKKSGGDDNISVIVLKIK